MGDRGCVAARHKRRRVHQVLEVRRARTVVRVAVAATLAVVASPVVDDALEVASLLHLDLLPGLMRQPDILTRHLLSRGSVRATNKFKRGYII